MAFQRPIEFRCIYVHRRTKFIVLSALIRLATVTRRYTLDVQFDIDPCPWLKNNVEPALLQIEFHLTEASPLVLLIDVAHVPTNKRKRRAIQLLCAKIFSPSNHLYTWKPWSNHLDGFRRCALLDLCDLTALNTYDVAQSFTEWYTMAFPRSRLLSGETAYSLQTAIFLTFAEWLDTSVQYAPWSCGIDVVDVTIDQRELRRRMQDYALNNLLCHFETVDTVVERCIHSREHRSFLLSNDRTSEETEETEEETQSNDGISSTRTIEFLFETDA